MWKSSVSRELLLQKITLIAILGPLRIGPKEYTLTSQPDQERRLSVEQEAEIVRNLAFLGYRRKDPQSVTAICIEEAPSGKGLVVRLAVSGTAISYAEEGLRQICAVLESVSRCDNAEQNDVNVLFQQVVRLDISRICARLQLSLRQDIESSHVMQLYRVVNSSQSERLDKSQAIQGQVKEFYDVYRTLKHGRKHPPETQTYRQVEKMITIARDIDQSPCLSALINESTHLSREKKIAIRDWVAKVGHYHNACAALVLAARRKRSLFQNIQVESFQIPIPEDVRLPSAPGSAIPLLRSLRNSPGISKVTERLGRSEDKACSALLRRLDSTRASIKIHAEIKLLFYYESHPVSLKPRVICANKSACLLCDLFLRAHGQFQLPMTFGKLNERWILPDWLRNEAGDPSALRLAVERFDRALDEQIQQLLRGVKRMPDPMESAIGLPAQWSPASSAQVEATGSLTRTIRSSADGSNLGEIESLGSANIPLPTQLSRSSVVVNDENLYHGESITKRLGTKDLSFTITFLETCVFLSFHVECRGGGYEADGGHNVTISLLQVGNQVDSNPGRYRRIDLEQVCVGHDVAFQCSVDDRGFYVEWKRNVVRIDYDKL